VTMDRKMVVTAFTVHLSERNICCFNSNFIEFSSVYQSAESTAQWPVTNNQYIYTQIAKV
jgi:hypothetical protein